MAKMVAEVGEPLDMVINNAGYFYGPEEKVHPEKFRVRPASCATPEPSFTPTKSLVHPRVLADFAACLSGGGRGRRRGPPQLPPRNAYD
jgi:hypothetical protein